MRGSKAKAIRRAVYGDQSIRQKRSYAVTKVTPRMVWTVHGMRNVPMKTIANAPDSLRAKYQRVKKAVKKGFGQLEVA